jgi:peptide/nickel transport system permease protein
LGGDVLSRLIYGARQSLTGAVVAVAVGLSVGSLLNDLILPSTAGRLLSSRAMPSS